MLEFDLSGIPAQSAITSAQLQITADQVDFFSGNSGQVVLYGYTGDGTLTLADAVSAQRVGEVTTQSPGAYFIDIASSFIGSLVDSAQHYVCFSLVNNLGGHFFVDSSEYPVPASRPNLQINYDPPTGPSAAQDSYTVNEDTNLSISAPGLLGNDSDPDSLPLQAVLVSSPTYSLGFSLNADGSFNYLPAANCNGTDSFTYQAFDGARSSAPATVTITILPVNDPAVANPDSYTVLEDTLLTVPVPLGATQALDQQNTVLTSQFNVGLAGYNWQQRVQGGRRRVPERGRGLCRQRE